MSGRVDRVAEFDSDDDEAERGEVLAPAGVYAVVAAEDCHPAAVDIDQPWQPLVVIDVCGPEDIERDVVAVARPGGALGAGDVVAAGLIVGDGSVDGLESVVGALNEFQLG